MAPLSSDFLVKDLQQLQEQHPFCLSPSSASSSSVVDNYSCIQQERVQKRETGSKFFHKKNKRVRFNHVDYVRDIEHLNSIPLDIVNDVWYTQQEYKAFARAAKQTIFLFLQQKEEEENDDETRKMKQKVENEDQSSVEELCIRGLERHLGQAAMRRRKRKKIVKLAVLNEQAFQQHHNIFLPKLLAQAAEKFSYSSRQEALDLAKCDEQYEGEMNNKRPIETILLTNVALPFV